MNPSTFVRHVAEGLAVAVVVALIVRNVPALRDLFRNT